MPNRVSAIVFSCLFIAPLLNGCGNGSDPVPAVRHFGSVNYGACDHLTIWLDLEAGRSKLSHRPDDTVDCTPGTLLATRGCTVTFSEIDSGRQLVTSIDDCLIPDESGDLFSCVFSKLDDNRLEAATTSACDCASEPICYWNGPTCRREPTICLGFGEEPGACEDCSNGEDDTGNGLVDCDDPDCRWSNYCGAFGPNNSTVTCPSSTSTTTTTTTP